MGQAEILTFYAELKLSKGFHERHTLNVSNGAAKFNDAHLRF